MAIYHMGMPLDVPEDEGIKRALASVRDAGDNLPVIDGPTIVRSEELAAEDRYRVDLVTDDPEHIKALRRPPAELPSGPVVHIALTIPEGSTAVEAAERLLEAARALPKGQVLA